MEQDRYDRKKLIATWSFVAGVCLYALSWILDARYREELTPILSVMFVAGIALVVYGFVSLRGASKIARAARDEANGT